MKLAWITPRFSPEGVVGGAETLIRHLASLAAEAGHEVHLLTTCARDHFTWVNDREPGEEVIAGLQVHYFRVNEDRDVGRFLEVQNLIDRGRAVSEEDQEAWVANSVCSRDLNAWLEQEGSTLDAVLAGPYLFGLTVEASRVCHGKFWLVPCLHDEAFARLDVIAKMFREAQGCLFNAEPERQLAAELYGLPVEGNPVVGMAIDPVTSDGEGFRTQRGLTKPYVLYCGRREEGKNTHLLFEYLNTYLERRADTVSVVLAGSGDLQPPETLRPHILDLGFVTEQEKHDAMAGASVFIHPSTNESFGIVLLEAWLAGTPAMVHDRGEVLRWQCESSGGGLWFRYYPEFEAMLDLLLETPELAGKMGEQGRQYVLDHYNRQAISDRLLSALENT